MLFMGTTTPRYCYLCYRYCPLSLLTLLLGSCNHATIATDTTTWLLVLPYNCYLCSSLSTSITFYRYLQCSMTTGVPRLLLLLLFLNRLMLRLHDGPSLLSRISQSRPSLLFLRHVPHFSGYNHHYSTTTTTYHYSTTTTNYHYSTTTTTTSSSGVIATTTTTITFFYISLVL